jgi:hypothetical protein
MIEINFNLFYSGSHPGSTVLLIFIEPVPTNFPNRILKTLLNPFLNSDFRSNAKENVHDTPPQPLCVHSFRPYHLRCHVGTDPHRVSSAHGKCFF